MPLDEIDEEELEATQPLDDDDFVLETEPSPAEKISRIDRLCQERQIHIFKRSWSVPLADVTNHQQLNRTRTKNMFRRWKPLIRGLVQRGEHSFLFLDSGCYSVLTSSEPVPMQGAITSLGFNRREILTSNVLQSKSLQNIFYQFLQKNWAIENEFDFLSAAMNFVRNMLRATPKSNDIILDLAFRMQFEQAELIDEINHSKISLPVMPIEFIVKLGQGVCRHKALLMIELLRYCVANSKLENIKIFPVHVTLQQQPHLLVTVVTPSATYLLDPAQNDFVNLQDHEAYCKKHGGEGSAIIARLQQQYAKRTQQILFTRGFSFQ